MRVFRSRAKTVRDQILKRALPVNFYRCHDCGWRRLRFIRNWRSMGGYGAMIGYVAALSLAVALVALFFAMIMTFLRVPMPWNR